MWGAGRLIKKETEKEGRKGEKVRINTSIGLQEETEK